MSDAKVIGCSNYSYLNKVSGVVDFGKPNGEMVLVGFADGMTLQAKQRLLNRYPQYQSIAGEIAMDSGVLTQVRLIKGSNGYDAERLISKLLKESSVHFAHPMFTQDQNDPASQRIGLTNEFMVSIEGSGTLSQLQKFAAQTKTSFVFSFSDEVHVMKADKNSSGSLLEILTLFNQQDFVTVAEPNLTFTFPDQDSGSGNAVSSKFLKKGGFKAFEKR
ncbi:hypothetical protein EFB08_20595 [Rufibacter latericius]|uniref:Uncharacterized protein n=2 Tax=Rufibacter latericius TaxID=2487040 RepID=A0A3M9MAA3_9BACT|nr:hypothetical protein EFB08_20595 [Rufibacter latericius]